jgi:hypothetical protein
MAKKRGTWAKPVPEDTKNKMITLRVDGKLYNALAALSDIHSKSLNTLCIEILSKNDFVDLAMRQLESEKTAK